jgi:hypothetical protein
MKISNITLFALSIEKAFFHFNIIKIYSIKSMHTKNKLKYII